MRNPSPSPSRFSKRDTEEYCDAEYALYRSFWDAEGSLHWGVFSAPVEARLGLDFRDDFLVGRSR